jgi:hypothetical protein
VQTESEEIEKTRQAERDAALAKDTKDFEENERKKSQKLIKQLAQRTISYAQFVKRINRMLAAIGAGEFTGSAQDEAAVVGGFSAKQLKALGLTPAQLQRIIQQAGALDGDQILDSYAAGTNYVPKTGLYELHQGERVVPVNQNRGDGPLVHIEQMTVRDNWSEDMFARDLLRQIERESRLTVQ